VGSSCEHRKAMNLAARKVISLPGRTQRCEVSYVGNIKLSLRKHAFNPRPVHAGFVVDIMAVGQLVLQFPCQYYSINSTHLFINLSDTNMV